MNLPAYHELLRATPGLSRYDPLERIVYYADFDTGYCGFTETIGNYEGSLDTVIDGMVEFRPPQLSNRPMWDTGTAGTMQGCYALKLATRAKAGSVAAATKRLTWRRLGRVRMETHFGFKPEADELELSETAVRGVGFLLDLQSDQQRLLPRLRYLSAESGNTIGKWQIKTEQPVRKDVGTSGKTASLRHYANEGYTDIPGATQQLCYNELPTKMNWHYLSVTFDLDQMRFTDIQCNDMVFDASGLQPFVLSPWPNLRGLLNTIFFVETDVDKRAFLYLDSVLFSAEG